MEDGTAPEMLVTHFVWRYRGRQTLKGVGRNPYLGGTTDGATEKALRRLQNSAESKRIVYYSFTNPAELAVQTVETAWPWQLPSRRWRRQALCSWRSCCWTQRPTPARY